MGVGKGKVGFLGDPVIVEHRASRRHLHLPDLRLVADGSAVELEEVVALHEILGEDLPVRFPDMLFAEGLGVVGEAVAARDDLLHRPKQLIRRRNVGIERDVDPAIPDIAAYAGEAVVALVEGRAFVHPRGMAQAAVEAVGPGMIGAGDDLAVAASGKEQAHPVQADVGEGPDLSGMVAHDEDRLIDEPEGEIVAPFRNGVGPAGTDPFPGEDPFLFQGQERFTGIDAGRRRPRFAEGAFRVTLQFAKECLDCHHPMRNSAAASGHHCQIAATGQPRATQWACVRSGRPA